MQDRPIFERTEDRQWTGSLPIAYYYLHKLSSSDMIITPNWHNEMEFLYTEATLTLYIDDKSYEMAPGDIAFINPRQIHRAVRNGPGEVYAFVFDLTLLKISDDNDHSNRLIDEVIHQKKQFITLLRNRNGIPTYIRKPRSFFRWSWHTAATPSDVERSPTSFSRVCTRSWPYV